MAGGYCRDKPRCTRAAPGQLHQLIAALLLQLHPYSSLPGIQLVCCSYIPTAVCQASSLFAAATSPQPAGHPLSLPGIRFGVGACRYDIAGWCTQPGALATWHVGRDDVNPSKPDMKITTSSCLMCCAFHPHHPVRAGCPLFAEFGRLRPP